MKTAVFVDAFREFNDRFIKLTEFLSAIQELSCVSVCHSSEQLLREALVILAEYQPLERCSLFVVNGEVLENAAGLDASELTEAGKPGSGGARKKAVFALGEGIIGLAAKSGELQHCRNCMTDLRFKLLSQIEGQDCEGSIIAVPVFVDGRVFAVLNVYHPHPYTFNEEHERLLTIFGKVLGQLLASSRYVHEMEQMVASRTRDLEKALGEAKELKRRYEELAVIDELTELHNRRFFFPEAEAVLARALRYQQPLSVLLVDLDHFKLINDIFGHAMGDKVLKDVAGVLKAETRAGDIVARYGGEEFAFVLPNTDLAGARLLAERTRERVRGLEWEAHDRSFSVSLSAGITVLRPEHRDSRDARAVLESLLSEADAAMYGCKKRGRDSVCVHGESSTAE